VITGWTVLNDEGRYLTRHDGTWFEPTWGEHADAVVLGRGTAITLARRFRAEAVCISDYT
jgi:hypothetical protein